MVVVSGEVVAGVGGNRDVGFADMDGSRGDFDLAQGKRRFGKITAAAGKGISRETRSQWRAVMLDGVRGKKPALRTLMLCGVVLLSFCSCDPDRVVPPELVEVHGSVLLDGQAMPNCKVVFVPEGAYKGSKWAMSYGTTDDQGNFQLAQRNEKAGANSGWHRVYVSYVSNAPVAGNFAVNIREDGEFEIRETSNELVPFFYNRDSELRFEVKKGRGISRPKFELSSIDPDLLEE